MEHVTIRRAGQGDADAISRLIRLTVRQSNGADYPADVIERVVAGFDRQNVARLISQRQVFVAQVGSALLGTASLEGDVVRSVFVQPDAQGSGLGRALMDKLEWVARDEGISRLRVPASLTARGFYESLGYQVVRTISLGNETTLVMERAISCGQ